MSGKEWRVLSGVGLVQVRTIPDGMIEVWEVPSDEDDSYVESAADLADHLRPLISEGEAEAFVEKLVSPFPADRLVPPEQRLRSYQRAFDSEDFASLVDTLHRLYNTADETAADTSNLSRFEDAVIDEVAIVLGTTPGKLKTKIRRHSIIEDGAAPIALPDRSAELATHALPPIDGWKPVGAFAIEGTIAIGDRPLLEARPGIWHAFYTLSEFELPNAIVVVHSDSSAEMLELLRQTTPDEHRVRGGANMDVMEGALRESAEWIGAYGEYDDLEIMKGRGFKAYMEADGDDRPGIVRADGEVILVHITHE